ncbi:hypothetical protein CFOL_v3_00991 [Cephalotus follicularis]|uniref:Uncharacterized protein n=1 Tax=Cephalotus follicularis TaxID=3775 RepID=A0A1Q3AP32_CEPFO|nr:hypothetical protein CFOL_v3_00991 [Cephalotus follicularis]
MAKPTNLLSAEHRLLHHITTTHILPTSCEHEKMSYQDLYIMWYIVTSKALNLPHLIMKNMLRAASKMDGAFPYGMVITKIISHFGIIVGNEAASRIDVGDIYNASSLKRMGWKRVYKLDECFVWLPKEGGRKKRGVEGKGTEQQGEAQRSRQIPIPQMQPGQSSGSNSSLSMEVFMAEMKKLHIKMDNMRDEFLDLFYDQRRRHRRIEKKLVAKGVIEAADISYSEKEEEK